MPGEIRVPPLGESVVEAVVGKWLKNIGDPIAIGDPVVELETDKVNLEVPAEQTGILAGIARETGTTVAVGDVLGTLTEAAVGATSAAAAPAAATDSVLTGAVSAPPAARAGDGDRAQQVTPVARRIAGESQIDLAQVPGSGPGGRVTKQDVMAFQSSIPAPAGQATSAPAPVVVTVPAVAPPPAAASTAQRNGQPDRRGEQRVRMSRRRQTIARRLVEAQHTAAMLTTFNEVDMSAVMEVRKRRRDAFKERHGVSLGFMSFFTKASVGALKAFPRLNAEIQGDEIVLKPYYDIGIAVGVDEGLVVPVVRDADRKSFAEIEREIAELAARARSNTLSIASLEGGTFTITNGGIYGSLLSTPILNAPQVGILGMHKIEERPIAVGGQVVIRPMMYVALSYDHRIVDGNEAVRFLVRIKELIEDPEALLLEG
jgi:2-oxoglutarate dehydrogenase E2 component (dihydrolipoamide succinyltransferase)